MMMNFYFNFVLGEVGLDSYFKEWLHDVSTDSEHLHILLPGDEGMKISVNFVNNLFGNMCHGRSDFPHSSSVHCTMKCRYFFSFFRPCCAEM